MRRSILIALLALMVAGIIGTVAAIDGCECPSELPGGLDPSTDLLAGQTLDVGDIYVWNDAGCLYVWYDITDDSDWYLTETHLDVECDPANIPQTPKDKKGGPNPIPGQFAYGDSFDITDYETSWCQAIDKLSCAGECGDLAIAAHAVVEHVADEQCIDIVSDTTIGVNPSYQPWSGLLYEGAPFSFPGDSQWIWKTDPVADPVNGEIVEFSKSFTIPGISLVETSGDMFVTCDNGYELKVNNAFIGRAQLEDTFRTSARTNDIVWWYDSVTPPYSCGGGPYGWQTVEKWDISGPLTVGTNTLQLTGVNEADTANECPDGEGTIATNPAGCRFWADDICYTVVDQEETAWGEGNRFNTKGNWGMYFGYDWQCCPTILVANGGFEVPDIPDASWNIFPSGTTDLGWNVEWYGGSETFGLYTRPAIAQLEIHDAVVVPPVDAAEGYQYAELDTDWEGPGGSSNGEPASVKIYQDICTYPGTEYTLTFAWKARNDNSMMEAYWGGSQVDGTYSGPSAVWTLGSENVIANGVSTRLEFIETGTPDSFGMFLDDVGVEQAQPAD